jgi:hypothetical protein
MIDTAGTQCGPLLAIAKRELEAHQRAITGWQSFWALGLAFSWGT